VGTKNTALVNEKGRDTAKKLKSQRQEKANPSFIAILYRSLLQNVISGIFPSSTHRAYTLEKANFLQTLSGPQRDMKQLIFAQTQSQKSLPA
jgi:hypothetical protein